MAIVKRSSGSWAVVIEQPRDPVTGKRRQTWRTIRGSKKDAQREERRLRQLIDGGIDIAPGRVTLGDFLRRWLEDTARPSVRPSTYERYRQIVQLHLIPALGNRPLERVSPTDLQALYAVKEREGQAAASIIKIHRVVHRALEDALRFGLVSRNTADAVRPPRPPHREMTTFSPAEARQFLDTARGDPLEALFVLAVTTGARQGELLALKWADVDLDAGRLQVRRTLYRVNRNRLVESEPKSARSRRSIALTPGAVQALSRHRQRQIAYRLETIHWEENDLVFADELGRHLDRFNFVKRSFQPLLERAGLPRVRFHDLRHTAATLLLGQGVHPKIVSEMLGHSSVTLTLDLYSHVTPTMQEQAAERMEAVLSAR